MQMRFAGFAALVLLAGCYGRAPESERNVTVVDSATETNAVVAAPVDGNAAAPLVPAFLLASDGLTVGAQTIQFSTPREATVTAIQSALGDSTGQGTNAECGAGPLDNVNFKGGLSLLFQDGKFVGWSLDGREPNNYRTAKGVGIGSTLQKMRDALGDVEVQSSTLGTEFSIDEMSGLLTSEMPDGKVTNMWAGVSCVFR